MAIAMREDKMAIEYIDRAACLSILRAKANMAVLMDAAPYFEKAAQMLEKLPTIKADLMVDAEWIAGDKMPNYPRIQYRHNRHYCSACEQPAVAYERGRHDIEEFLTPRCPECGAYMRDGG